MTQAKVGHIQRHNMTYTKTQTCSYHAFKLMEFKLND